MFTFGERVAERYGCPQYYMMSLSPFAKMNKRQTEQQQQKHLQHDEIFSFKIYNATGGERRPQNWNERYFQIEFRPKYLCLSFFELGYM